MSEERDDSGYDPDETAKLRIDETNSMADRLSSLRASIRASKNVDARKAGKSEESSGEEDSDDSQSMDTEVAAPEEPGIVDESSPEILADDVNATNDESEPGDVPDSVDPSDPSRSTDELHRVERADVPGMSEGLSVDVSETSFAEVSPPPAEKAKPSDERPTEPPSARTNQMNAVKVEELRQRSSDDANAGSQPDEYGEEQADAPEDADEPDAQHGSRALVDEEPGDEQLSPSQALADEPDEAGDEEDAEQAYDVGPTVVQNLSDFESVQGTPLYMSPEQIRAEKLGPETDVYSLGVMLFELLEERPPYNGLSVEEVLVKHQDAAIPEQNAEFTPDDVRDLVNRMLAKGPTDRPDTAEIIEVLQRHVSIGGPDVHGLEEESWTVDVVETDTGQPDGAEDAPASASGSFVNLPTQLAAESSVSVVDEDAGAPRRKLAFLLIGIGAAVLAFFVVLIVAGGGDETEGPAADEVAVAEPTEPTEPTEVAPSGEEPEQEEPAVAAEEGFEFGFADTDAGIAGTEPDAGPEEVAAAEPAEEETTEVAKEEPKKKKRRSRPKKKKKELRELRLEL